MDTLWRLAAWFFSAPSSPLNEPALAFQLPAPRRNMLRCGAWRAFYMTFVCLKLTGTTPTTTTFTRADRTFINKKLVSSNKHSAVGTLYRAVACWHGMVICPCVSLLPLLPPAPSLPALHHCCALPVFLHGMACAQALLRGGQGQDLDRDRQV